MALPLLPLALKGLAVAGAGAVGSGAGYGVNKLLPEDNFFSRWWNRTETGKIKKRLESVRRSDGDSRRKTMAMFEDMGIKTDDLIDEDGQVNPEKLDEAYAQARQKIKERGGNDLPEDASLADLHKAYRASDPARNPSAAKTSQKAAAQGTGPQDGTLQKQPGKGPPLTPRGAKAPADPTVTPVRKPTTSGVVAIDGIPDLNQTETRGKLEAAGRNKAAVLEANSNTARKDAQYAERRADRTRESQELRDRMERADDFERWRSQRNERIKQERADTRFRNRTLSNREDWENLGREGSNRRDYTRKAEGETNEQFQAAVKERQGRVDALRKRLAEVTDTSLVREGESTRYNAETGKMEVIDQKGGVVPGADKRTTTGVGDDGFSYANKVYANTPARLRQIQELQKLVGDGKNVTDAQIEGATKTLDKLQGVAEGIDQSRAMAKEAQDRERMRGLRRQYGMEDSEIYDDAAVKKYHDSVQSDRRKKILEGMAAGGASAEAGKYGDAWQQLRDTGFDPRKVFKAALADGNVAKSYNDARMKIDTDGSLSDQAKAEARDQLKHKVIMRQAFKTAGIEGADVADVGAMRQKSVSEPSEDYSTTVAQNVLQETNPSETTSAHLRGEAENSAQATKDANAEQGMHMQQSQGLPPQMNVPKPLNKKKETQQSAKGGDALRPRRRR